MGTSGSAGQLAVKLRAAGKGVERATLEGVREAAIAGKAIFEAELVGAVGGRRLSGVGRKGAKVGARFTNPTSTVNPTAIVMYTGPVHLVNSGNRPHWIAPRNANHFGNSRGKGAHALYFPDGEVRGFAVFHPGTAGKEFYPTARERLQAAAPAIMQRAENRELRKVFGVAA